MLEMETRRPGHPIPADTERRDACVVNYAINYHLITGVSSPAACFVSAAARSPDRAIMPRDKRDKVFVALLLKTPVKISSNVQKNAFFRVTTRFSVTFSLRHRDHRFEPRMADRKFGIRGNRDSNGEVDAMDSQSP